MTTARAWGALPMGWKSVHDLRRTGARLADIDRIAVGPAGVYVISAAPSAEGVAISAAADAAITVLEMLPGLEPDLVVPVLCVGDDTQVPERIHGVLVCAAGALAGQLRAQPKLLTRIEVGSLSTRLRRQMPTTANWSAPRPRR